MSKLKKTNYLQKRTIFENETFEKFVIEKDISIEGDVHFTNCIFKMPLVFDRINITGKLHFYNCTFSHYSSIKNSTIDTILILGGRFEGTHFNLISNQSNILRISRFKGKEIYTNGIHSIINISNIKIEKLSFKDVNPDYSRKDSKIQLRDNTIEKIEFKSTSLFSDVTFERGGEYENVYFEGRFNNPILFQEKTKIDHLFLESSIFNSRIDIREGTFENIYFYRCSFNGIVVINSFDSLNGSESELQIKNLTIHSNTFDRNISMSMSKLDWLDISNNDFKKLFQLNAKIYKSINLNNDINISIDGANQGSIFIQEAQLNFSLGGINIGNINLKNIIFSDLYIRDFQNKGHVSFVNTLSGNRFTIQDSSVGNLEFLNTDINNFDEIVIADSNLENINFSVYPHKIKSYSSNPKVGYGIDDKSRNNSNLKHIYNQLKQVARKKGDIDIANKYQSLEYKQLLLNKRFGFDKLLLFLNLLSNNNGRSWFRGVSFTLIVAFLFFYIYLYVLGISFDWSVHLKEYVFFITSFPKLQLEKYAETNISWQVSLVIWISRIFISYGIYQTIAAFRKYGKG